MLQYWEWHITKDGHRVSRFKGRLWCTCGEFGFEVMVPTDAQAKQEVAKSDMNEHIEEHGGRK